MLGSSSLELGRFVLFSLLQKLPKLEPGTFYLATYSACRVRAGRDALGKTWTSERSISRSVVAWKIAGARPTDQQ